MHPIVIVLLIALPLISALAAGLICWNISGKKGQARGYELRKKEAEAIFQSAEAEGKRMIGEAAKEGERKKREYLLAAKEEIHKSRIELEKEIKDRRNEVQHSERRLIQKEENLDKKLDAIEQREKQLNENIAEIQKIEAQTKELYSQQQAELERISCLTRDEARTYLLANVENDIRHETVALMKEYEAQLKDECERKAKEVIGTAIQKCAADYVSEMTVSVVPLPNEDMKGRIIGREGRNIRALETLTGIDLIIDDTPEAVILSGYHPIRREVARIALERLIVDGRIHPARIEEMVEKARKEVDNVIRQEGENATYETGVYGLHPEMIKLLGRLKYRTSYGQSVLIHSIEVSRLAGVMAAELGVDVNLAKRAGLVHDIGKSVDFEQEGSHIEIGAELAKRYKEGPEVINAIMSHHGDVEPTSIISVLVQAADSISAARPGARRETLEAYVKRLEKLEEIAQSFDGVDKTYAIQAGREIRIMVKPDKISDDDMVILSKDIAKKIEDDMEYPGQIKVTMIRETREVATAK
ncbi:MAG: ribonuclease Y [Clostridia bacterium]|nr:ribonuclease Y [Clostridia bacterium]